MGYLYLYSVALKRFSLSDWNMAITGSWGNARSNCFFSFNLFLVSHNCVPVRSTLILITDQRSQYELHQIIYWNPSNFKKNRTMFTWRCAACWLMQHLLRMYRAWFHCKLKCNLAKSCAILSRIMITLIDPTKTILTLWVIISRNEMDGTLHCRRPCGLVNYILKGV